MELFIPYVSAIWTLWQCWVEVINMCFFSHIWISRKFYFFLLFSLSSLFLSLSPHSFSLSFSSLSLSLLFIFISELPQCLNNLQPMGSNNKCKTIIFSTNEYLIATIQPNQKLFSFTCTSTAGSYPHLAPLLLHH